MLRTGPTSTGIEKSGDGPWSGFIPAFRRALTDLWDAVSWRITDARAVAIQRDFRQIGKLVIEAIAEDSTVGDTAASIIQRSFQTTAKAIGLRGATLNEGWVAERASVWADLHAQSMVNGMREAAGFARQWKLAPADAGEWLRQTSGLTQSQVRRMAVAKAKGADLTKFGALLRQDRARVIAEHQAQFSYQQGQRAAYAEVVSRGGRVSRRWVIASSACDKLCRPMAGRTVSPDGLWTLPDGRQVETPVESHPHCRCHEVYTVAGVWKREGPVIQDGPSAPAALAWWVLQKYSPGQARVPAGQRKGGQWVKIAGPKGSFKVRALPGLPVKILSHRIFDHVKKTPQNDSIQLLKQADMGALGERLVQGFLTKTKPPLRVGSLNNSRNNEAADLVYDHRIIEVKGGNAANTKGAQQWRVTHDQKLSAREEAYVARFPKAQQPRVKADLRRKKQVDAIQRKYELADKLTKRYGVQFKTETWTLIVNTKTKRADLFSFAGICETIKWNKANLKNNYRGSLAFSGWTAGIDAPVRADQAHKLRGVRKAEDEDVEKYSPSQPRDRRGRFAGGIGIPMTGGAGSRLDSSVGAGKGTPASACAAVSAKARGDLKKQGISTENANVVVKKMEGRTGGWYDRERGEIVLRADIEAGLKSKDPELRKVCESAVVHETIHSGTWATQEKFEMTTRDPILQTASAQLDEAITEHKARRMVHGEKADVVKIAADWHAKAKATKSLISYGYEDQVAILDAVGKSGGAKWQQALFKASPTARVLMFGKALQQDFLRDPAVPKSLKADLKGDLKNVKYWADQGLEFADLYRKSKAAWAKKVF
jgi:hypothetical protein